MPTDDDTGTPRCQMVLRPNEWCNQWHGGEHHHIFSSAKLTAWGFAHLNVPYVWGRGYDAQA